MDSFEKNGSSEMVKRLNTELHQRLSTGTRDKDILI